KYTFGRKAWARALDSLQALYEETRPGDQNKTERHLYNDEDRAETRSAATAEDSGRAGLHRTGQINPARMQSGRECDENRGEHANSHAQRENTPIDLTREIDDDPGRLRWKGEDQRIPAPVGKDNSAGGGERGQNQAFDEKLLHQPAAAGTERQTRRHFML